MQARHIPKPVQELAAVTDTITTMLAQAILQLADLGHLTPEMREWLTVLAEPDQEEETDAETSPSNS